MTEPSAENAQVQRLALDLMNAKHPDNPDAPASMVRAGCALPLAEALWDLGWRAFGRDWVGDGCPAITTPPGVTGD